MISVETLVISETNNVRQISSQCVFDLPPASIFDGLEYVCLKLLLFTSINIKYECKMFE